MRTDLPLADPCSPSAWLASIEAAITAKYLRQYEDAIPHLVSAEDRAAMGQAIDIIIRVETRRVIAGLAPLASEPGKAPASRPVATAEVPVRRGGMHFGGGARA